MEDNEITEAIIGAAIEVHRQLGPGLLEGTYEVCLAYEIGQQSRLDVVRQVNLPVQYKALVLEDSYRIDLLVSNRVIVEIKSVETVLPVHKAQLLTYLRLTNLHLGLLINFNVAVIKNGITRIANGDPPTPTT
jgi:GxxExxY protein